MDAALKAPRSRLDLPPSSYIGSKNVRFFEVDADEAWKNQARYLRIVQAKEAHPNTLYFNAGQTSGPSVSVQGFSHNGSITLPFSAGENFGGANIGGQSYSNNAAPIILSFNGGQSFGAGATISVPSYGHSAHVFQAIQALCLSPNRPRDRQIADRIINLHRDVLAEGEQILAASLSQMVKFFLDHPDVARPKIFMTPDGTLRARWINGPSDFIAIEFTGLQLVKIVAEIPRAHGQTATFFATDLLETAVSNWRAAGASFGR
jgi:hypothetical protein